MARSMSTDATTVMLSPGIGDAGDTVTLFTFACAFVEPQSVQPMLITPDTTPTRDRAQMRTMLIPIGESLRILSLEPQVSSTPSISSAQQTTLTAGKAPQAPPPVLCCNKMS